MSNEHIIRAWKDPEYRNSLDQEELNQLPENPAAAIELTDEDLENVSGGHQFTDGVYCEMRWSSIIAGLGGGGEGTRDVICIGSALRKCGNGMIPERN